MNITGKTYTIDAAGRTLGRVASEAAKALMGKTSAQYTPHIRSIVHVSIINASKVRSTERKRVQTFYTSYSGYPGGLKRESLQALQKRKGSSEILRRAVRRMMPRNTMLVGRMKNLTISE